MQQPVSFATVYLLNNPVIGTASGSDGTFTINTDMSVDETVVVSFIGYEKAETTLAALGEGDIVLREQPIALQEMVITAPLVKQRNKRQRMAKLLDMVYEQMQQDFPDVPVRYKIVSDVRMNISDTFEPGNPEQFVTWGMEQMIASVVNIPGLGKDGNDSVQFIGEHCKRFFQQHIRERADDILESDKIDKRLRDMATEMDSGVVVHVGLWFVGNIKYDFEKSMKDIRHWVVSNESDDETVLTHTEKKNYLGLFKYEYKRHYILDSHTLSVRRFSEELDMAVNIPFGYKLKEEELALLNLLNISEKKIEQFRLRKSDARITLNTIYQRIDGRICIKEKNLVSVANIVGTKKIVIPINLTATQRVTYVKVNAAPFTGNYRSGHIQREIVPIF